MLLGLIVLAAVERARLLDVGVDWQRAEEREVLLGPGLGLGEMPP